MNKILRTCITLTLITALVLTGFITPVKVQAAEEAGGTWGELTWTLDSNGTLTISGSGDMDTIDRYSAWGRYGYKVRSVIIEPGVTNIAWGAFSSCMNLSSVTIADTVTSIGVQAFYGCRLLNSITIPDSVTGIGYAAFGSTSLVSVVIPNGITSIAPNTFQHCTALRSITIPAGVSTIEANAFENCPFLTSVSYAGSKQRRDQMIIKENNEDILYADWQYSNEPMRLIEQPSSVAVEEGQPAKVVVKATGDGLTYKWYYKDAGASKYTLTTTFTGNTYKVTMNGDRDGRYVFCRVYDQYGNMVQTNTVKLSLKPRELKIHSQPASAKTTAGKYVEVKVRATGDGLTYKWYYKDKGASSYTLTNTFKGDTYKVVMNEACDGRQVLCRIYDRYGNVVQTRTVKLSMAESLQITAQPVSAKAMEGEYAEVKVGVTGEYLTYKWYYKDAGASKYTLTTTFTGNTYKVPMDASRDGRYVYCRVYDGYGNMVQTKTVKLSLAEPVKIITQPASVTVAEGEMAVVTVGATGDGLTYRWYYKDAGASSYTYTASYKTNTYKVTMNEARDGRQLLCRVYDQYGNVVQTKTVAIRIG